MRIRRTSSKSSNMGQIQVRIKQPHQVHSLMCPMCPVFPGHLQVIFGPMFSGKSTELIRRLKRYQIARYECLIIKYSKDTRYDEKNIATHDRQTLKASVCAADRLSDLKKKAMEYDVIGIDEGQFVSSNDGSIARSLPFWNVPCFSF